MYLTQKDNQMVVDNVIINGRVQKVYNILMTLLYFIYRQFIYNIIILSSYLNISIFTNYFYKFIIFFYKINYFITYWSFFWICLDETNNENKMDKWYFNKFLESIRCIDTELSLWIEVVYPDRYVFMWCIYDV